MKKILGLSFIAFSLSMTSIAKSPSPYNFGEVIKDRAQYFCRESDETKKCKCDCLQDFCDDNGGKFECGGKDTTTGDCVVGWCNV